ncbi:hypothetical protein E3O47_07455 [Cryobacterium sp. TMT2-17-1]|uniref:hypothetical protein n=1 Tax=Cryobacterium sp. TMT2-17-1 TaxID=1259248 RepID=UPI00106D510A|nr:hypothetical protein [Cryobacterium sp. TMT2-17-1]TFC51557.1 hypothetical protein E3O47_07455 [Cryobacterium sp. TMT2-17-1]
MSRRWNLDQWMVFFWGRLSDPEPLRGDDLLDSIAPDFEDWAKARGKQDRQPFLIGPGGTADNRVNEYFNTSQRRRLSRETDKGAAYAICLWLNFLIARRVEWDAADELDIEAFMAWRRFDHSNPKLVQGNTWQGDISHLLVFYRWASHSYGLRNPIATHFTVFEGKEIESANVSSHSVRQADVKWLSPGAYARWRDIGVLGMTAQGDEKAAWRPRCDQRDLAYVEGLYRTGLRMQEWSSVLISELPAADEQRWFYTLTLANMCAKGGYGHPFWIDRGALNFVRDYVDGDRAASVLKAQANGSYSRRKDLSIIVGTRYSGRKLVLRVAGLTTERALGDLTPAQRMNLFYETDTGLEPAMLWLNENGLPRPKSAWYKSFSRINARVERAGLANLRCTQHMLRHSFALRWYTVGKLIRERRVAHLTEKESQDFRAEFGSAWHLVQTMLGHRNTETTKQIYLEPFLALDINLLFEHAADDVTIRQLLDAALRDNPSVISTEGTIA